MNKSDLKRKEALQKYLNTLYRPGLNHTEIQPLPEELKDLPQKLPQLGAGAWKPIFDHDGRIEDALDAYDDAIIEDIRNKSIESRMMDKPIESEFIPTRTGKGTDIGEEAQKNVNYFRNLKGIFNKK